MKAVNILHAETNPLIREGVKALLANEPQDYLVSQAVSKNELERALKQETVDLVIIGLDEKSEFKKDTVVELKKKYIKTNILIITSETNKTHVLQLLDTGIDGYLTTKCDLTEVKNAIRSIVKNDKFFCNSVLNILLEKTNGDENCYPSKLTEREVEIIKLIATGLTSKQMAEKLFLSTHTINTHRKNIMKKIGVKGASEVIVFAMNEGLLDK